MKTNGNDIHIESYKIFPYVAWGVTILFTLFVYSITMELKEITQDLQQRTQQLQIQINTPVLEIEDLEA